MKKHVIAKYMALILAALMVISLFSCVNTGNFETTEELGSTSESESSSTDKSTSEQTESIESVTVETETTDLGTTESVKESDSSNTLTAETTTDGDTTESRAGSTESIEDGKTENTESVDATTDAQTDDNTEESESTMDFTVAIDPIAGASYLIKLHCNGEEAYLAYDGNLTATDSIEDALRVFVSGDESGWYIHFYYNGKRYFVNAIPDNSSNYLIVNTVGKCIWSIDRDTGVLTTSTDGKNKVGMCASKTSDGWSVEIGDASEDDFNSYIFVEKDEGVTVCYHPYSANAQYHWKPACAHCNKPQGHNLSHNMKSSLESDLNGNETVVYRCTVCGYREGDDKGIPDCINLYLDHSFIANQRIPGGTYQLDAHGICEEGGVFYERVTGRGMVAQLIWTRIGAPNGNFSPSDIAPLSVGKAKYLIIKMRGNNDIKNIEFRLGTIVGEATQENHENQHEMNINLPQDVLNGNGWTTYVLDLGNVWSDCWVADSSGNYTVSYLQFTFRHADETPFNSSTYIDISYMAFVDNIAEAEMIIDTSAYYLVTDQNKSEQVGTRVDLCYGEHTPVLSIKDGVYAYECSVCQAIITSKSVPDSVNKFITSDHIANASHYAVANSSMVYDNGSYYARMYSHEANHIHIWSATAGGGSGLNLAADTGRYLVMKIRVDEGLSAFTLGAAINNANPTATYTFVPGFGEWHVMVIDLERQENYTCNAPSGTLVQFRLNAFRKQAASGYVVDIAYVAVVDNLAEAASVIDEDTFEYYNDPLAGATIYDTATQKPAE